MSQTHKEDMNFETALARLEEIVRALEEGKTDLDSSLAAFEEGVGLVRFCTEKLDGAEHKVKILAENTEGYEEIPFEE